MSSKALLHLIKRSVNIPSLIAIGHVAARDPSDTQLPAPRDHSDTQLPAPNVLHVKSFSNYCEKDDKKISQNLGRADKYDMYMKSVCQCRPQEFGFAGEKDHRRWSGGV